jgi:serine/threonine protein kinase
MLLGLNYMHGRKILHRDFKTLNVFLDEKLNVRLGDLGVAKVCWHMQQRRMCMHVGGAWLQPTQAQLFMWSAACARNHHLVVQRSCRSMDSFVQDAAVGHSLAGGRHEFCRCA